MDNNLIILNGEIYKTVKDEGSVESCKNCSFRNNAALCHEANRLIECNHETPLHFVRSSDVDLRSATEQMKSWEPTSTITMHENQPIGTKYDQDKLQYSLIPSHALEQIAKNLTVGLKKYKERDNWKKVDGAEQRYLDALYRHLEAHRRGEIYDTDSSVPDMLHMAAVAVNAMFLLEFMLDPKLNKKEK